MPTIQAQDIVNAVIQDSQIQTTNRAALYDYVDRTHQRILRESQWRFLLSDPKQFVTMPGVSSYTLVSGTAPAGSFQTPLMLTDFNNVAPGTVFDLSTWSKIEEDSDSVNTYNYLTNRDGSLRLGQPRTYSNSIANPGTITLIPAPDGNNLYYPVPETPAVSYAVNVESTLPIRTYYGIVTFVDSLGGESTQCITPIVVTVPAGNLVTVSSPNPPPGGINGAQVVYGYWNLYMGTSPGNYNIQNINPIPIGTSWTETVVGLFQNQFPVPSYESIPFNTVLSINSTGQLSTTTPSGGLAPPYPYALVAPNGSWWEIIATPMLSAQSVAPTTGLRPVEQIYLTDTDNVSTWAITINSSGSLEATVVATPPTTQYFYQAPPTSSSIQPLNAYVIQFRYSMARKQIANPTDVLQVPYIYKDIVIAGTSYLASLYLDRNDAREPSAKTMIFKRDFEQGLAQIRRDLRISYRKTDFIAPDIVSQYVVGNQQGIPTMGW